MGVLIGRDRQRIGEGGEGVGGKGALKVYVFFSSSRLWEGVVGYLRWKAILVLSSSLIKVWATELRRCVKVEEAILGSCPQ